MADSNMDSVWWWHLVIATALTAVHATWTLAVLVMKGSTGTAAKPGRGLSTTPSDGAIAAALTIAGFAACWNYSWQLKQSPGVLPALGWSALAGWELNGMESPVLLSVQTEWTLLLAPFVGLALRLLRTRPVAQLFRQRSRDTSLTEPAVQH